jgi:hypothetical protein
MHSRMPRESGFEGLIPQSMTVHLFFHARRSACALTFPPSCRVLHVCRHAITYKFQMAGERYTGHMFKDAMGK